MKGSVSRFWTGNKRSGGKWKGEKNKGNISSYNNAKAIYQDMGMTTLIKTKPSSLPNPKTWDCL